MVVIGHRDGLRRHGRLEWENPHPSLRPGEGEGIVAGGLLLAVCAGWGAEPPLASETTP